MYGRPLLAFSVREARLSPSVSAEAPGYTACTVTTGGAISGYCAIGSERIDARPASTMKVEMTAAKSGRSMKKRENMVFPCAYFDAAPEGALAGLPGAVGAPDAGAELASLIGPPGCSLATPVTVTVSPALSP